ncbi:hypothetical protein [Burkholderia stabilis]|uniref:hypothetical protein n=1 Tax=Burkholderia stabilis TaxID=95485 RepID=UPI00164559B5|nr:hypothetical protein [Burkholderia stabilis]
MTHSAAYPAHPVMSIFPGAYLSFRRAVKFDIFNDSHLSGIHHIRATPTVRQVTQRELRNPNPEIASLFRLNSFIRIVFPRHANPKNRDFFN